MKEMGKKGNLKETVVFAFSEEEVLRELTVECAYVAKSMAGAADLKTGCMNSITDKSGGCASFSTSRRTICTESGIEKQCAAVTYCDGGAFRRL